VKFIYAALILVVISSSVNAEVIVNIFPDKLILPSNCELHTDLKSETFEITYSCITSEKNKYWLDFRLNDTDLVSNFHRESTILDIAEQSFKSYVFQSIKIQAEGSVTVILSYCTPDICMDVFGDYDEYIKNSLTTQLGG